MYTYFSSSAPLDTAQAIDTIGPLVPKTAATALTVDRPCASRQVWGLQPCFIVQGPQVWQASFAPGAAGSFQAPVLSSALCLEVAYTLLHTYLRLTSAVQAGTGGTTVIL